MAANHTAIAIFTSDYHGEPIIDSNIYWNHQLHNLTELGLETLETNTSKLPGFRLPTDWATLTCVNRDKVVATAIVQHINAGNGQFYQYNNELKTWGMPIEEEDAIAHAIIPLTFKTMEGSEAHVKKWKDYIKTHRDIGLITMFWFHKTPAHDRILPKYDRNHVSKIYCCSKIAMFLTLVVQIMVPTLVAIKAWDDYGYLFNNGFCLSQTLMSEASSIDKSLAWAVAVIFFTNMVFLFLHNLQDKKEKDNCPLNSTENGGILQITVMLDRQMYTTYEPFAYLVTLFYIFVQQDTYNIIFSATSLQFLFLLDDVLKERYIQAFPPVIEVYMALNNEDPPPYTTQVLQKRPVSTIWHKVFSFFDENSLSFIHFWLSISLITIFFIPICKPFVIV